MHIQLLQISLIYDCITKIDLLYWHYYIRSFLLKGLVCTLNVTGRSMALRCMGLRRGSCRRTQSFSMSSGVETLYDRLVKSIETTVGEIQRRITLQFYNKENVF